MEEEHKKAIVKPSAATLKIWAMRDIEKVRLKRENILKMAHEKSLWQSQLEFGDISKKKFVRKM